MAIRSDEIVSIIKSAIDRFDDTAETRSVGTVVEFGDGIAQIYGLEGALASELLEFPNGSHDDQVDAVCDAFDMHFGANGMLEWAAAEAAKLSEPEKAWNQEVQRVQFGWPTEG